MTTMNTGAASLSDERERAAITACALMIKGICLTRPNAEWTGAIEDRIQFMLKQMQAGAAIAAGGAQEAVAWQVRRSDGRIDGVPIQWENCTKELYDATLSTGRYAGYENGPNCEVRELFDHASPLPRVAATGAVTDEQIVSIWEGMPDGASGFRKSWGYMQFARALIAASNGEQA